MKLLIGGSPCTHWRPVRLWGSIKEASAFLGVNPSTVACVCKGKRRYKSTGGYKFRYAEEVVLHG